MLWQPAGCLDRTASGGAALSIALKTVKASHDVFADWLLILGSEKLANTARVGSLSNEMYNLISDICPPSPVPQLACTELHACSIRPIICYHVLQVAEKKVNNATR